MTGRLSDRILSVAIYGFVVLYALFCMIPIWMVVIGSFTVEAELRTEGFQLFPSQLTTYAYDFLLSGKQVLRSYGVTILVTGAGTLLAMFVTSTMAYVIAHPKVKYKNIIAFLTYFTMLFGSGLVGFYILIANWLDLKDSIWALILPYLLNPFFAFILVAFFRNIPFEVHEAATIDGANDFYVFFRIILPISMPAMATVGLFYALQYWNDWWLALLFIDDYKLHPLQIMIRQLISNINAASYISSGNVSINQSIPAYGVQLATACLTIGPIVLLYPFIQRFFVKGLTIGALKG